MEGIALLFSVALSGIERLSINLGFTLTPIFLVACFVLILAFLKRGYGVNIFKDRIFFIVLAVYIVALLSCVSSPFRAASLKSSLYVLIYVSLIYCLSILPFTKNSYSLMRWGIYSGLCLFSLYGILQYLRYQSGHFPDLFTFPIPHNNALSPLDFVIHSGTSTILRPNSGFNDVNAAAAFALLYLPIILYYTYLKIFQYIRFRKITELYKAIGWVLLFLISLYAFILMASRAALIAIFILIPFIVILLAFRLIKNKKLVFFSLVVLVVVIFGAAVYRRSSISTKLNQLYNQEYSAKAHVAYTDSAIREFRHYPLTGGGVGSFYQYFQSEEMKGIIGGYYPSVDNPPMLIKVLAEEGILGFIAYLILFSIPVIICIKKFIKDSSLNHAMFWLSFAIGFVGLFLSNLFHSNMQLFFTAVFIGLVLWLARRENNLPET